MPLERNPDTAEMRKTTLISFNENEEWASQNVEIYSEGAFLYQKVELEVAITTNSSCFARTWKIAMHSESRLRLQEFRAQASIKSFKSRLMVNFELKTLTISNDLGLLLLAWAESLCSHPKDLG